jgi:hypothetical protein
MKAEKKENIIELIDAISTKLGIGQESKNSLHKAIAKVAKDLVEKVAKAEKKEEAKQKALILKGIKKQEKATKKAKLNLAVEVAIKKLNTPAATASKAVKE